MAYRNSTTVPPSSLLSEDRKAIGLILIAMLAFSSQDVMIKAVLAEASVWQAQLIRSFAVIALLALVAVSLGKAGELRPSRLFWPTVRAVFMCGAYLFFYASLPFLTISQASASFFIGPILITLFAAIMLREPIGPKRIAAIAVGFTGVLFIVRPDGEMQVAALMPVCAAVCYAMGVVVTRWRCRSDPAFALSMVHNGFYAAVAALAVVILELWPLGELQQTQPALAIGWASVSLMAWLMIFATAVTHTIGTMTSIRAYQLADASRIAPFEYSYLAVAPVWDALVFGTVPSVSTCIGMTLIAASGGFVAWREGRPARARPQNYGEIPWTEDSTTPIPDPEER